MLYYLRLKDDKANRRWKVREAVSLKAAINSINFAMATGSIGSKDCRKEMSRASNGDLILTREVVLADIVRVNSDNSEAQAYQLAY